MTREVIFDLGNQKLGEAAIRMVYGGIVRLASNEPDLLGGIAFDGRMLRLEGVTDDGERVIAKLGDYLSDPTLREHLESVLDRKPVLG